MVFNEGVCIFIITVIISLEKDVLLTGRSKAGVCVGPVMNSMPWNWGQNKKRAARQSASDQRCCHLPRRGASSLCDIKNKGFSEELILAHFLDNEASKENK